LFLLILRVEKDAGGGGGGEEIWILVLVEGCPRPHCTAPFPCTFLVLVVQTRVRVINPAAFGSLSGLAKCCACSSSNDCLLHSSIKQLRLVEAGSFSFAV
jgi:hypothetical protein